MSQNGNGAHAPVFDLASCSNAALNERVAKLTQEREKRKAAGTLPPNPFSSGDGWYDITPAMAYDALLLTSGNRSYDFKAMKGYADDMAIGDWKPTAEAIGFTGDELDNGHHRLLASYLGGHTFRSYVIASTPDFANRFAYYDQGKRRTVADSLHIAGWNGTSKTMAAAITGLAMRYEARRLVVIGKQPNFKKTNGPQALLFMDEHSDFDRSAQHVMTNYVDAIAVIRDKATAVFFGHLILKHYDGGTLDSFFRPLATGANLAEDSVILGLRNRLLLEEVPAGQTVKQAKLKPCTLLALLIKGFKMHIAGEIMPRSRGKIQPFSIPDVGQPYPRIESEIAAE